MENLRKTINNYIENNETILSMTASNPRDRGKIQRLKIRPVRKKEKLIYQAESFVGTKVLKQIPLRISWQTRWKMTLSSLRQRRTGTALLC